MGGFNNLSLTLKFCVLGLFVALAIAIPTKLFYDYEQVAINASQHEMQTLQYAQQLSQIAELLRQQNSQALANNEAGGGSVSPQNLQQQLATLQQSLAAHQASAPIQMNHEQAVMRSSFLIIAAVVLVALLISVWVIRSVTRPIRLQLGAIRQIAEGDYNVELNTKRKDELGQLNQGLVGMASSFAQGRSEREREEAEKEQRMLSAMRVEAALNATSTNVMIADAERNIIYMNQSVEDMLRAVESDLRQALPHFSVDTIVGSNMDIFHKNPAHQKHLLQALTGRFESNITVAGLHFRLTANPIYDATGERIGSVVEWLDRTAEVGAQQEVGEIVKQAAAGNFTVRVKETGKNDFMLFLAQSLNQLMSTADEGLADIARVLMAMSDGDMSARITQDYSGQFDDLKRYCNQTSENLSTMIGQIRSAAETINAAATEIAQGNSDLSNRTETQASSLEETASSMEEITATVRLNADNAQQANVLASDASKVAEQGGVIIAQVVTTMGSINDSARKISDIIGVIDGIAFQTNILALNAAVEAARAGEQGRGFAVVASEVRTLAQRSANAAKDIKSLISDSVAKITDGNELVNQSGDTMGQIVEAIKQVNMLMSDIASASAQQASGIDEINRAVTQMDEMTQQNAALVEEAAASAESLKSQAGHLEDEVARFVLDENDRSPVSTPLALSHHDSEVSRTVAKASVSSASRKPKMSPKAPDQNNEALNDDDWEEF
ncbi:methyl-accepting chemotaxis protein [Marinomonas ostreistagni]|uniref:methyl-accepting chemotaxis protein n=1 Tax=Marinomonas ostreistagni TaxID=359209 RepID=UPI001951381A|nr:methyl-accepting chemotaxis protein [Marinomonas ostreistagni]MBM6551741.1 HAMP domain-containing protein [Marinomonas ostreistagni]